jgi:biopolymer transport protein ExbD
MAFASASGDGPMADINVTPLVDVMLVLLIIFMITAPLVAQRVRIHLPLASVDTTSDGVPPPMTLAIRSTGELYWNDAPMSPAMLEQALAVTAQRSPQPQVNVRADQDTRYEVVSDAVQTLRRQGIRHVGFVTSPEPRGF